MTEEKLSIDLDVNQINLILSALAQLPYGQVCTLIDDMRRQAERQIAAAQQTAEAPAVETALD